MPVLFGNVGLQTRRPIFLTMALSSSRCWPVELFGLRGFPNLEIRNWCLDLSESQKWILPAYFMLDIMGFSHLVSEALGFQSKRLGHSLLLASVSVFVNTHSLRRTLCKAV